MLNHRIAYACIGCLILFNVTLPFNPLFIGAGPASFLYHIHAARNTILPHPFGTWQSDSIALVVNFLVTALASLTTLNSAKRARLLTLANGMDKLNEDVRDIRATPALACIMALD